MTYLVDHDPDWCNKFDTEAVRLVEAAGDAVVRIHHIGSTAIPPIYAKPIIDILLEVTSLDALDQRVQVLEALGYEAMGEFGIAGRRYFRLNDAQGTRTHHVHAFAQGVAAAFRHVAFRDYMRAHPRAAEEYNALKQQLAARHPHDMAAYIEGKDTFIKEHERLALAWAGAPAQPG